MRGLLTHFHPSPERVLGPRLDHQAVTYLLERYGSPATQRKAGRRRLVELFRPKAPRTATRLIDDVFDALDEQTVVVPGTGTLDDRLVEQGHEESGQHRCHHKTAAGWREIDSIENMTSLTCRNRQVILVGMSLRHAVLGLLVQRPSTGYELAKLFDRSLMTAWHARHSQIYPELTKLESRGFVEVASEGPRSSRTWRITREGREELRAWLVEKEPSRIQRNESAVRLFFAGMLAPGDRQVACERDLAYVNEQIRMLEETREQVLAATPPQYFLPTIELGLRVNAVYRDWLQEQIDQAEHEAGEIHD